MSAPRTNDAAARARSKGADALAKAARLAQARAGESRQAATLISSFVADALGAGIEPTVLTARSYSSDARYRTNVAGWYIRRDRSVGVGTDGGFYILSAPGGLSSRLRGVELTPSDPPLELGRGARDGESLPLADALAKRLAAGGDYPR